VCCVGPPSHFIPSLFRIYFFCFKHHLIKDNSNKKKKKKKKKKIIFLLLLIYMVGMFKYSKYNEYIVRRKFYDTSVNFL
jgi:hypothetical protein